MYKKHCGTNSVSLKSKIAGASITNNFFSIIIAAAVVLLTWLKKKRKHEQNQVLPSFQFATLPIFSGIVDILIVQGSDQSH